MKTEEHQIVIVGAGPAGSTASLFLSKVGIHHVLIDKSVFPRDKICGDALSGKVISQLRRLDPAYEELLSTLNDGFIDCHGVRFVSPKSYSLEVPFTSDDKRTYPQGYISKRIVFDQFLVSQLKPETCDFRTGHELKGVEEIGDGKLLRIKTAEGEYSIKARLVIAADGAHSILSKKLAGFKLEPDHNAAGIRAYYKNVSGMHPQNYIELHFLPEILPGYFWVFPLPNGMANVGVGMISREVSRKKVNLKEKMLAIINEHPEFKERFKNAELQDKIMGWGLPLGTKKRSISGNHYLLTGDAASLIDPFTGEGIGNAMICGRMAAEVAEKAIKEGNFSAEFLYQYDNKIYKSLGDELRLSHTLLKLIRFPWLFDFIVKKANRNKTLKETISCMFENVDLRARFKDPLFYLKILFG